MGDGVIVLGMHRSGTSSVAGVLTMLGGSAPRTLMAPTVHNARGFFESDAAMQLHEELLQSAGTRWDDWRPINPTWMRSPAAETFTQRAKVLFEKEFGEAPLPVLKDPRICRFAPFWLNVLDALKVSPHVVMPIRSPLAVAQSLRSQHGMPLAQALLLWLRHVLDAERDSRSTPRSLFTWESFRADWRGVCERIGHEAKIAWPRLSDRSAREIDHFLTDELVHQDVSYGELSAHSSSHEWVLRVYDALLELVRNPQSNSALSSLDEIREALDVSGRIYGRVILETELGLEQASGRLEKQVNEILDLKAVSAQREAELQDTRAQFEAIRQANEDIQRQHESKAADVDGLTARLAALEHDRFQSQQIQTDDRVRLEIKLANARDELARSRTDAQALEARLDEAATGEQRAHVELDNFRSELRAATDEIDRLRTEIGTIAARAAAAERDRDDALEARAAAACGLEKVQDKLRLSERDADLLTQQVRKITKSFDVLSTERQTIEADLSQRMDDLFADLRKTAGQRDDLAAALLSAQRDVEAARHELHTLRPAQSVAALNLARRSHELAQAYDQAADLRQALKRTRAHLSRQQHSSLSLKTWVRRLRAARREQVARVLSSNLLDPRHYCAQASLPYVPGFERLFRLIAAHHYLETADFTNALPNPIFDGRWYRDTYPDLLVGDLNPLLHYAEFGWREGRDPGPEFSTTFYLDAYHDVRTSGVNPLAHYLMHGRAEGRMPRAGAVGPTATCLRWDAAHPNPGGF